jgi:hypothetical protein
MTNAAADWNREFDFARERAHTEHATSQQATIRRRLDNMRATSLTTPSAAQTGTFGGYAAGLADLLTDEAGAL